MQEVPDGLSSRSGSDRCRPLSSQNRFRIEQRPSMTERRGLLLLLVVALCGMSLLSGCGVVVSGGIAVSPGTISFGAVPLGQSTVASVTLTNMGASAVAIQQLTIAGSSFSLSGSHTLPITIPAAGTYQLQVQFSPASPGAATGSLMVNTNAANGASATVNLDGTGMQMLTAGPAAVLNGVSCGSGSITGAGTDSCTVTLSGAAGSGGLTVNLTSSSTAVAVPSSVTVPANGTSASFSATVSAVASPQTVTLTASAGGVDSSTSLQLNAATGALVASVANLAFGNVSVGTSASQTVTLTSAGVEPVTISQATLTGAGFADSGVNLPVVLNPNQLIILTVTFDPAAAGSSSGQLQIVSNAASGSIVNVALSGTGTESSSASPSPSPQPPPALAPTALSCASSSVAGPATVSCGVTLSAAAPAGGFAVALASNSGAVIPPGSVTVPAGSTTAAFSAAVSAVNAAQTAVLTATANGIAQSFSLQLNPGGALLNVNATSVAFGNVSLNTTATQSVVLASVGSLPVTVNGITLTGIGFSLANPGLPLTLNPGQTTTLNIGFDPTLLGLLPGLITISSNATNGATILISLSGTGAQSAAYAVDLAWDAPVSSADPVAGYNVYRSAGGGSFQILNASVNQPTTFVDSTVQNGVSYVYYVTSVDSSGVESVPSNSYTVSVP